MESETTRLAQRLRNGAKWIKAHGRGTILALQDDLERAADLLEEKEQRIITLEAQRTTEYRSCDTE